MHVFATEKTAWRIGSTFCLQLLKRKERIRSKIWERKKTKKKELSLPSRHRSTVDGRRKGQTGRERNTSPLLSETVKAARLSPTGVSSGGDGYMVAPLKTERPDGQTCRHVVPFIITLSCSSLVNNSLTLIHLLTHKRDNTLCHSVFFKIYILNNVLSTRTPVYVTPGNFSSFYSLGQAACASNASSALQTHRTVIKYKENISPQSNEMEMWPKWLIYKS